MGVLFFYISAWWDRSNWKLGRDERVPKGLSVLPYVSHSWMPARVLLCTKSPGAAVLQMATDYTTPPKLRIKFKCPAVASNHYLPLMALCHDDLAKGTSRQSENRSSMFASAMLHLLLKLGEVSSTDMIITCHRF